jgi:hypothetical protein
MEKSTVNLELISKAEYSAPSVMDLGTIGCVVMATNTSIGNDGTSFAS